MADLAPLCYDCLSPDVTIKVIDLAGCEHYFCAEDWAANEAFHEKFMAMLADASAVLEKLTMGND